MYQDCQQWFALMYPEIINRNQVKLVLWTNQQVIDSALPELIPKESSLFHVYD